MLLFFAHRGRRLSGIERRPVVWNLHKMAGLTQQCTAPFVREPERLLTTFATGADYLFQPDKANADLDAGDRALQCGRRVDAQGMAHMEVTRRHRYGGKGRPCRGAADHATLRGTHDVAFIVAGDFTNVCLTWVPPELRPFDLAVLSTRSTRSASRSRPAAKAAMQAEGSALIGYQPVHGINCFRLIFMNPAVTHDDVDILLDLIAWHSEAAAIAGRLGTTPRTRSLAPSSDGRHRRRSFRLLIRSHPSPGRVHCSSIGPIERLLSCWLRWRESPMRRSAPCVAATAPVSMSTR